MEFKEGLNEIFKGNAIIFLGAGFSRENLNKFSETLPLARELSISLQSLSGIKDEEIDENLPIQTTSEFFIEEKGKSKLVDFLREKFTVFEGNYWQRILAKQDWKRIYTTNYDNVFEVCSNEVKKHRFAVDISKEGYNYRNTRDQIVHLNGYIDFINENNLSNSTKLTNESYTDTYFIDGPWRTEFGIDLDHAQAIFFVGFSLDYDLDLKRIIQSNNEYRDKIFFINGSNLNKIQKISLEKYGNVINMNASDFSKNVEEAGKLYTPVISEEITTLSFNKSKIQIDKSHVSDKDVSDLFFYGIVNEEKIFSAVNKSDYIISRTKVKDLVKEISNVKAFLVQGKLGNGKTIFLKNVESELVKNGYTVYVYNGNPNDLLDDIEKLKASNELIVLVIDDYYSLRSQFRYFSRFNRNDNIKLIISGRTFVNANNFDDFLQKTQIESSDIISINMDYVDTNELYDTFNLIENHNLWGKKSSLNSKQKQKYLSRVGRGGFQNIALEIVTSNNLLKRLNDTYNNLNMNQQNLVIAILINNLLSTRLKINQLSSITNNTMLRKNEIDDPNFKEFVDIDNNIITVKSSLAAKEILKLEKNKNKILSVMETMIRVADSIDVHKTYEYLKRELVSFSNFRLIIKNVTDSVLNDLAVKYFENIRNLKFSKENPFFWLQYGIQRLDAKDYEMANKFFDNALSFADKRGLPDFYQINAQKARGIIEQLLESNTNANEAFVMFEKAHYLLINDLEKSSNNKYYQLSQGQLYEKFYIKYYDLLSTERKIAFNFIASKFSENIEKYISELERNNVKVDYLIKKSQKSLKNVTLTK